MAERSRVIDFLALRHRGITMHSPMKRTLPVALLTALLFSPLAALFGADAGQAAEKTPQVHANGVVEWTVTSSKGVRDPFNDIELWFVVTEPDGQTMRAPGFRAGGQTWRGRNELTLRESWQQSCFTGRP